MLIVINGFDFDKWHLVVQNGCRMIEWKISVKHMACVFINCIEHHTIAEACVNKFGCYLRFVFINNHLDICVFFNIFPEFSKGMRKNDRLFKGNEITLNMLTKTLCVARFWRFTIIGQAPKVNRFISFKLQIVILDIPKWSKAGIIHNSDRIIGI